jgi:hypothetical protein
MAKVARIQHYASLLVGDTEIYGVATLVPGGYSFKADDSREYRLIDYRNADLMLFGRVDLATEQYLADELRGGPAGVACDRTEGRL